MIKAYDGEKPFVFVSYSHKDWQRVALFIKKLQDNLCHVWFDEGIKSGSVWNDDLAEHLIQSDVILLFLSSSSIESEFVLSEVNFGRNHNKKILPVYLEPIELPIGLEFQLSTIQAIHLYQFDDSEALKRIIKSLPDSVFLHTETPFYIDSKYSFYLRVKETLVPAGVNDREVCGFQISRCHNETYDEQVLFEYFPTPAYGDGAQYTVTLCNKICDKYFNEEENGVIIFNINAKFYLSYPLSGPDFCALMSFVIVSPNGDNSSVKLVDCKIKTSNHDYDMNQCFDSLKKELWGSGIEIDKITTNLC